MTTIGISDETREQLDEYRAPGHETWEDVLCGLMRMVPPVDDIEAGCAQCGATPVYDGYIENVSGVIQWLHIDSYDMYHSEYFCSPVCAREATEERQKYIPEYPDRVHVGGYERPRASFEGARFYIDGETREVAIDVPGAFSSYAGEPVYISNEGEIVQDGVVEEIIHEDAHTVLLLGRNQDVVETCHPNRRV